MKPVENEELIEADIIRVFFHSENETFKCLELMPTEEEKETLTFEDIYNLAKKNGLAEEDMYILMIAENPLSGKVYKHGNYKQGSNLLSSVPAGTDEGKSRKKKGGI
ncbi:hypothetical protein DWX96_00720 [Roseburia sp. AF22-2LB]|uniref:hypothetical protein n=1 Tax=unclassified Roseburia TaxID=2637578 RepID=UPI000E4969C4|nr:MULTISPECIES: hypothetical protein [unclassified Roseburia]RGG41969.1 hypothetical protein DWY00_01935 [Roseburia sp. AF22-8AC]RGG44590.1 hypothetical protein DWX96_00720 [Roseburia sp. AF22-2LB]